MLNAAKVLLILSLLAGCAPHESPWYDDLAKRTRSDWVDFARGLSLAERFTLYSDVYNRSGHPPDTILADAFSGEGRDAFDIALMRMRSERTFFKYLPILFAIHRGDGVDLCSPTTHAEVIQIMIELDVDSGAAKVMKIDSCGFSMEN
jgi:hypothetical protein